MKFPYKVLNNCTEENKDRYLLMLWNRGIRNIVAEYDRKINGFQLYIIVGGK